MTQYSQLSAAISASVNGKRIYHRGLSKQMMKVRRYSANGSTQRNGMTATSWQILFVVASSNADAQAGSSSQRRKLSVEGRASREEGSGFEALSFPAKAACLCLSLSTPPA